MAMLARGLKGGSSALIGGAQDHGAQLPLPVEPLVGRVLLPNGDEVSCTAVLSSPLQGEIFVRTKAAPGEVVICALDGVGILVGKVTDARSAGFGVAFMVKHSHREKVAARLEWHVLQANRSAQLRRAPRLIPIYRSVEVRLAETVVVTGTILNISMSGAAITLRPDPGPFAGALLRVGSRFATVVRAIEGGVAVQFVEPFTEDNFDERIRL